MVREMTSGATRFLTWDTETNTALASRTVPDRSVEMLGVDAAGKRLLAGDLAGRPESPDGMSAPTRPIRPT